MPNPWLNHIPTDENCVGMVVCMIPFSSTYFVKIEKHV